MRPGTERYITLDYPETGESGEYTYEVWMRMAEDCSYARCGHEICFGQFIKTIEEAEKSVVKPMQIIHGDVNIGVKGDGFHVMFSKSEGGLALYSMTGQNILHVHLKRVFGELVRIMTAELNMAMIEECGLRQVCIRK